MLSRAIAYLALAVAIRASSTGPVLQIEGLPSLCDHLVTTEGEFTRISFVPNEVEVPNPLRQCYIRNMEPTRNPVDGSLDYTFGPLSEPEDRGEHFPQRAVTLAGPFELTGSDARLELGDGPSVSLVLRHAMLGSGPFYSVMIYESKGYMTLWLQRTRAPDAIAPVREARRSRMLGSS